MQLKYILLIFPGKLPNFPWENCYNNMIKRLSLKSRNADVPVLFLCKHERLSDLLTLISYIINRPFREK